jgi:hypothetical protein
MLQVFCDYRKIFLRQNNKGYCLNLLRYNCTWRVITEIRVLEHERKALSVYLWNRKQDSIDFYYNKRHFSNNAFDFFHCNMSNSENYYWTIQKYFEPHYRLQQSSLSFIIDLVRGIPDFSLLNRILINNPVSEIRNKSNSFSSYFFANRSIQFWSRQVKEWLAFFSLLFFY